ncbi:MAG: hypothetical protein O3C60_20055 [Planctomycetota bacterium]|nr:hypothetical protein [Planctomycetota bacterium]
MPKIYRDTGQIESLKSLTPAAAAWLMNYRSTTSLRTSATLPRNEDGTYDAAALLAWKIAEVTRNKAEAAATIPDDALEYKRRLEAKKLEIQLLELEKLVVPTAMVQNFTELLMSRIRSLGEVLQRQYGRDALLMLNETIEDLESTIGRWEPNQVDDEDS